MLCGRAIPTWWRWNFPASSAATMRRSTPWWRKSWSTRARRTSATIGYFLKRYREDIVRNKQKTTSIDEEMRDFEARLRRQMLREKLEENGLVRESFETGSMPQIHVSLGAREASRAPVYGLVGGG